MERLHKLNRLGTSRLLSLLLLVVGTSISVRKCITPTNRNNERGITLLNAKRQNFSDF
jgi:hypothetical protein